MSRTWSSSTTRSGFLQEQAGHSYASTTAIYTGVSDDYRNRLLQRSLTATGIDLWEADS